MTNERSDYRTLIAFPELKDAMNYVMALSKAGIEHRLTERFRDFDPTFADNRTMDQVRIEVRGSDLDKALKLIENVDGGAEMHVIHAPKKGSGSIGVWIISSIVLLLSTLYFANKSSRRSSKPVTDHPLFQIKEHGAGFETVWKETNEMASEHFDKDANGVTERAEFYNKEGDMVYMWIDEDQDGMIDEWRRYDDLGKLVLSHKDMNADGVIDETIIHSDSLYDLLKRPR